MAPQGMQGGQPAEDPAGSPTTYSPASHPIPPCSNITATPSFPLHINSLSPTLSFSHSKPKPSINVYRALDLFSGSHSVGNRLQELGFEVISLDIRKKTYPTISCDILKWDHKNSFPKGHFTLIAASVPCTEYSQAKTICERDLVGADQIVAKVLAIIQYFEPPLWWIENPRGGYLKTREVVKGIAFLDIDYCQFCDWGYQSPPDFGHVRKLPTSNPFFVTV